MQSTVRISSVTLDMSYFSHLQILSSFYLPSPKIRTGEIGDLYSYYRIHSFARHFFTGNMTLR